MLADQEQGQPSGWASRAVSNGSRASGELAGPNTSHNAKQPDSMRGSRANGGPVAEPQETFLGHNREEVTRILIQALVDLGYHEAANIVGKQSGFQVESADVTAFRKAVLSGSWARAEELLCGRVAKGNGGVSGQGLVLAPGADRNAMRFQLRQQKFLELLEQRETAQALAVLRNELTPLCAEQHQSLHLLSRFLMCQDAEDLRIRANWDGANGRSRQVLLSQLLESVSPSVMLPEHRLAVLLDELKRSQVERCLYHTADEPPSLYMDHSCDRSRFPSEMLAEMVNRPDKTRDEVWQIRFSPDGRRLASCGTDETVTIWDVESFNAIRRLHGHQKIGVCNVEWGPDSRLLVSCGFDRAARLWDTETGECLKVIDGFGEPVSSCVWAPDGQTFITGSFDKTKSICQWNLLGDCVQTWAKTHRTEDLALSRDQRWLVALDEQHSVHVYSFATREHVYQLALNARATSVSISRDSRHVLVNKADNEAVLIDLETRETVQKYVGQKGGEFTIRSDFGGANENFILSGSEDGRVLVWHKTTAILVHEAEAHPASCNAVAWSPNDPCMFATCGDDGKIRIWSNPERKSTLPPAARHSNGTARETSSGSLYSR